MADDSTPLTRRELRAQREHEERQLTERAPVSRRRREPAAAAGAGRRSLGPAWLLTPVGLGGLWLGTHLLAAAIPFLRFGTSPDRWNGLVVGGVYNQFAGVSQLARLPAERVLPELPPLSLRLLQGLYAVTGDDRGRFLLVIVLVAVIADLVILITLWRAATAGPVAAAYWALAVPLLGPVALARLDLVVVALVVLAWVMAPRRPLWAGVLLAVATGLGFWPAAVVLPLLALVRRDRRRAALTGYAVAGLVLAAASVLGGGWGRVGSPVTRALSRGLSLESFPGLPALVDMALSPGRHSASLAGADMVVRGPWVDALSTGSAAAALVAVGAAITLGILVLRRPGPESVSGGALLVGRSERHASAHAAVAPVLVAAAGLLALLVTARTLCPEALGWVLPFLALRAALRPGRGPWLALGVVLLTQLANPYLFQNLAYPSASAFDVAAVAIGLRNLALVAVALGCLLAAVRELRSSAGVPAGK